MLVSEMTAVQLYSLLMLAFVMFYLAQIGLRYAQPLNWLGHVVRATGAIALLGIPALIGLHTLLTG